MATLIKGGRIVTAIDDYEGDVLIEDGKVRMLGRDLPVGNDVLVHDAKGLLVMPGAVDVHTHLDWEFGSARSVDAMIRPRLAMRIARFSSAFAPAPMPMTTIRPPVSKALRFAPRFGAPTSSRTTSNGPCSSKPSGSMTASAPSCATASRASGLRTVAVTRAPTACAS